MSTGTPDNALQEKVEQAAERALALARPRAALRVFRLQNTQPISLEGSRLKLTGSDIQQFLMGAREVAVFVVTLGIAIDRELQRLSATSALDELVFDAVATALVERAADAVSARVVAYAASQDMHATGRFSPGYGDLRLIVKRIYLPAWMPCVCLALRLPHQTLWCQQRVFRAVMGIGQNVAAGTDDGVANSEGACRICKLRDFCALRKAGRTCRG